MKHTKESSADSDVIPITIVDDHPAVLLGLQSMLSANDHLHVIGTFSDGGELLKNYREMSPSVLLLDLRMPGKSGLHCIPTLRDRFPETRILVLSSYQMDEEVFQALDAGASGFLSKSALPDELYRAIERVFAGKQSVSSRMAGVMRERNSRDQLSDRELEIVRGLTTGDTNKEIAKSLHISEYTVRNHVNNILGKLHARDRTEAVVVAIRKGLVPISDT